MLRLFFTATAMLALAGCSIKQTVTPAAVPAGMAPEICMIPAAGLRSGFHTTYQAELEARGFRTRSLRAGSSASQCPLATTYVGHWGWDLALYMKHAHIRVFADGRQVGEALYDSRWGGARLDKFIDAERKIAELTAELFPQGAALLSPPPAPAPAQQAAAAAPVSRQARLEALSGMDLSYEEYQHRYREIMAQP